MREVLRRHPRLWCDLAFRGDHATGGQVDPAWREAFTEFPDRFMVGTDTFTPERWQYIGEHARYSRGWLADLPAPLAERIGWRNAEAAPAGCGAHLVSPARQVAECGGLTLVFAPGRSPLSVGRHFALDIAACAGSGSAPPASLRVDADMPAHRHGINYKPTVQALGDGRFVAAGLMFHMPGHWRLLFYAPGGAPLTWEVTVP